MGGRPNINNWRAADDATGRCEEVGRGACGPGSWRIFRPGPELRSGQGRRTLAFFHAKTAERVPGATWVSREVARERAEKENGRVEDPSLGELEFPDSRVKQAIEVAQVPI
jgi:hypothetical protein